jgi:hypothetical protein
MEPGVGRRAAGRGSKEGSPIHFFPSVVCSLQPPSIRMDLRFEKVRSLSAVERTSGIRALRRHSIPLFPRHAYCGWPVRHRLEQILTCFVENPLE